MLSVSNNEVQSTLFGGGATRSFSVGTQNFAAGQIQRIVIQKNSANFQIADQCQGATFSKSCTNNRQVTEIDRYLMTQIQLWVNGQLIYSRGGLNHIFTQYKDPSESAQSYGLAWHDDNVSINPAWVAAAQMTNCTAMQQ